MLYLGKFRQIYTKNKGETAMLIEFSVANFKSIKDRQTLSMVASKNQEDANVRIFSPGSSAGGDDIKLLPAAAIYGANASGKSNLLSALDAIKKTILFSSSEVQSQGLLWITPFKLDPATQNKPTEFEIVFVAGGVRYQYGFSATKERIVEEWLLAYPQNRAQRWLGRVWANKKKDYEWLLGANLKGEKNLWKNATRENALFLSTAVQFNSRQLSPVYGWFQSTMRKVIQWSEVVPFMNADTYLTSSLCAEGDAESVLAFLRNADLDIYDVQTEKLPLDFFRRTKKSSNAMGDAMDNLTTVSYKELGEKNIYEPKMVHKDINDNFVVFDLDDESDGTRKVFALAFYWLTSLRKGDVLVVDELHEHLHPKLVQYLVGLFSSKKTNPNNAQLIFATHDTSLMDQKVLRRDQIWFCEINSHLATEVYPLTDFHPRKGRGNLRSAYLSGSYGALPHIKSAHG